METQITTDNWENIYTYRKQGHRRSFKACVLNFIAFIFHSHYTHTFSSFLPFVDFFLLFLLCAFFHLPSARSHFIYFHTCKHITQINSLIHSLTLASMCLWSLPHILKIKAKNHTIHSHHIGLNGYSKSKFVSLKKYVSKIQLSIFWVTNKRNKQIKKVFHFNFLFTHHHHHRRVILYMEAYIFYKYKKEECSVEEGKNISCWKYCSTHNQLVNIVFFVQFSCQYVSLIYNCCWL